MSGPTIKMPAELLAKWLAALRSGEYEQVAHRMCNDDKTAFCCLGVLVEAAGDDALRHCGTPRQEWLADSRVTFANNSETDACQPYLPSMALHATEANDSGKTFAEIADAIEACAEAI